MHCIKEEMTEEEKNLQWKKHQNGHCDCWDSGHINTQQYDDHKK